jgi:hypothetical protein
LHIRNKQVSSVGVPSSPFTTAVHDILKKYITCSLSKMNQREIPQMHVIRRTGNDQGSIFIYKNFALAAAVKLTLLDFKQLMLF